MSKTVARRGRMVFKEQDVALQEQERQKDETNKTATASEDQEASSTGPVKKAATGITMSESQRPPSQHGSPVKPESLPNEAKLRQQRTGIPSPELDEQPKPISKRNVDNEAAKPNVPPPRKTNAAASGKDHDQMMADASQTAVEPGWFSPWRSSKNREYTLEKELANHQNEFLRQRQTIFELRDTNNYMKHENFELREKIKELNALIRQTQENAFGGIGQGKWTSQPDRNIRDDLALFQRDIRDWSKEYVIESIPAVSPKKEERTEFLNYMSQVMHLSNRGIIPAHLNSGKMQRRSPSILLSAVLAHQVYSQVFNDAFYFLGQCDREGNQESESENMPVNDALNKVYAEVKDLDEQEAHNWRSQLLRIFHPPQVTAHNEKERNAASRMNSRIRQCSTLLAMEFYEGPARHLFRRISSSQENSRLQKLIDIFIKAGSLSTRYWTQRTFLKCYGISAFSEERFKVDSPILEAHPSHGLDDDEDDRLDGSQIDVVVHPAILAFGNDDGEGFQQSRVWAKAVVLLKPE